jgi:hypothetical protein
MAKSRRTPKGKYVRPDYDPRWAVKDKGHKAAMIDFLLNLCCDGSLGPTMQPGELVFQATRTKENHDLRAYRSNKLLWKMELECRLTSWPDDKKFFPYPTVNIPMNKGDRMLDEWESKRVCTHYANASSDLLRGGILHFFDFWHWVYEDPDHPREPTELPANERSNGSSEAFWQTPKNLWYWVYLQPNGDGRLKTLMPRPAP